MKDWKIPSVIKLFTKKKIKIKDDRSSVMPVFTVLSSHLFLIGKKYKTAVDVFWIFFSCEVVVKTGILIHSPF